MFSKKLGGSVVAITAVFAFSPAFAAECDQATLNGIADRIKWNVPQLICAKDADGQYVEYPIWQFGKKKSDPFGGCEVHDKLAKQLYVPHDDPPINQGKSKTAFREAQGAANALYDNKPVDALLHLNNFLGAIDTDLTTDAIEEGSAKLNPDNADAENLAKAVRNWAYDPNTGLGWRTEVEACQPETL